MSSPRTTQRWFPILALVAIATMINYLDRTVLGIAAPYLTKELGLTAEVMEELTRERPMRIRIPVIYDGEGRGTSSESE